MRHLPAVESCEPGHADVDTAIDAAYKDKCMSDGLLAHRPDRAAAVIQWWDREWFMNWIEENRPPPGVDFSRGAWPPGVAAAYNTVVPSTEGPRYVGRGQPVPEVTSLPNYSWCKTVEID